MRNTRMAFVAAVGILIMSTSLSAHHGSAQFDIGKRVTVKGTVTEWFWTNPHCLLSFDVTGDDGKVVHWVVETQNGPAILGDGYSKGTFKAGDVITVTLEPFKNGKPLGRLVSVVLPDGRKLEGGFLNSKSDTGKE
jgi:hypothetical protein